MDNYKFSTDEQHYVNTRFAEVDTVFAEIRGFIKFVASREKLDGQWDMEANRDGLYRVEKT